MELDLPKLKSFPDNILIVAEMVQFLCDRVENIVRKGENAGNRHFFLYPQCFLKPFLSGPLKLRIVR